MAIQSKRESILEYILGTTMHLIDGTGHYNLDLQTVSRSLRVSDALKEFEFPAVFILDDTSTMYTPMTMGEMVTGTSLLDLTNGMPVVIAGMVKVTNTSGLDKAGALSTEMNKMFSDIVIAMYRDTCLGGNCENVELVRSTADQQHDENEGVGIVVCEFAIKYRFSPRATVPVT